MYRYIDLKNKDRGGFIGYVIIGCGSESNMKGTDLNIFLR